VPLAAGCHVLETIWVTQAIKSGDTLSTYVLGTYIYSVLIREKVKVECFFKHPRATIEWKLTVFVAANLIAMNDDRDDCILEVLFRPQEGDEWREGEQVCTIVHRLLGLDQFATRGSRQRDRDRRSDVLYRKN
jgi:hypothetical protein